MMFKTENELREVISLGKPGEVIDIFLESYLQGLEFEKWKEDKDLEATEEVITGQDEDGNDIVETRLVNVYELVDVSKEMIEYMKPYRKNVILKEIEELEKLTLRPLRDLYLNKDDLFAKNKLEDLDSKISILREEYKDL